MDTLRKTPLNQVHREMGAKMVPFGGWDMPVEYAGLISEHMAVRQAAGLFDVSHMGEFTLEGPGALAFLQRVTCNDAAKLVPGQAQYTALPMPNGAPVDDCILYRRSEDRFLLIVNAGNLQKDWQWLLAQGPKDCRLEDHSDATSLIAIQGPRAAEILQLLTPIDLSRVGNYHFAEGLVNGTQATLARTGYTGEDGFEIGLPNERAEALWRRLIETGRDKGLVAAGLGARDTLRLEAKMALYGNDIDESTTLIEAGLGWIVSLEARKGAFNGRGVLEAQKQSGVSRKLVGFEMTGRGIARHGYPVVLHDAVVGSVNSGTYAPFLQKNIGLCYLPTGEAAVGTEFSVEIRGKRVAARVVPTPFYKRPR